MYNFKSEHPGVAVAMVPKSWNNHVIDREVTAHRGLFSQDVLHVIKMTVATLVLVFVDTLQYSALEHKNPHAYLAFI